MPRLLVNNYLLAGKNADFEVAPTFTAATNTGARWIDGTAAGIAASDSAYKWATISGTTAGTWTASFDNTVSYSGSYSMKLTTGAAASATEVGPVTAISVAGGMLKNAIQVAGSTQYTGRFRMKTEYISGDGDNGAYVNFNERTAAAGGSVSNLSTKVKTTTDWTLYTVTFTTASGTRYIVPRLAVTGTGGTATLQMNAWFDSLEFFPTTEVARTAVD